MKIQMHVDLEKRKVLLGICSYKHVEPRAYASHLGLIAENTANQLLYGYDIRCEMFIAQGRNEISLYAYEKYLAHEITDLMFVDDDMIIPQGTMAKMLNRDPSVPVGVVSALYANADGRTQTYCLDPFGQIQIAPSKDVQEVKQVDAAGMGCCIITGEALAKVMEYRMDQGGLPFNYLYRRQPVELSAPARDGYITSVLKAEIVSEDIYFCESCKEAGVAVGVMPGVIVGHVKSKIVVPE